MVRAALRKAVSSGIFDLIVLSSDDKAILNEAEGLAVTALRRNKSNASDTATSESVLVEVLNALAVQSGTLAMIQCTTPLLTANDIIAAMALYVKNSPCTVVSGYVDSPHHWVLSADNGMVPVANSGFKRRGRQEAEERIFVENGGIYVTDVAAFLESGNRFNGTVIPYFMDQARSFDIDTEYDLEMAKNSGAITESGVWGFGR
jgi:N-acylneuraminate cytidylyltransferase